MPQALPLSWRVPPQLPRRHCSPISAFSPSSSPSLMIRNRNFFSARPALCRAASWKEQAVDDGPSSIELEPVVGEEEFDRVVKDAQRAGMLIVVLWTANWCRKCIYLKPKLEKLAATYYPRIRFYCVDVNSVPQKLVNRAGIIKMPTVQIWKDCNRQDEIVGGHKAWLVVNELQQLLENED